MKIKICGITRVEDALLAQKLGAWAVGFNFFNKSPRFRPPAEFTAIIKSLGSTTEKVGVFVNQAPGEVVRLSRECGLTMIQLHGDETPETCRELATKTGLKIIKAFRVRGPADLKEAPRFGEADYLMIDARVDGEYGGTGHMADWASAKSAAQSSPNIILAGGLTPENVARAALEVKPFAVDVASGVEETPGIKSDKLMKQFFAALKKA